MARCRYPSSIRPPASADCGWARPAAPRGIRTARTVVRKVALATDVIVISLAGHGSHGAQVGGASLDPAQRYRDFSVVRSGSAACGGPASYLPELDERRLPGLAERPSRPPRTKPPVRGCRSDTGKRLSLCRPREHAPLRDRILSRPIAHSAWIFGRDRRERLSCEGVASQPRTSAAAWNGERGLSAAAVNAKTRSTAVTEESGSPNQNVRHSSDRIPLALWCGSGSSRATAPIEVMPRLFARCRPGPA